MFEPACGSAGMFVQTGHFIAHVRHGAANDAVTFHEQEKSDTNTELARMNLVVHGLDASNIVQGNTFYDQAEHLVGRCDFVMANPPFNVDGVDTKKAATQVGEGQRLPFGMPPVEIRQGSEDVLAPDVHSFVARVSAAGGQTTCNECQGGFHVFNGAVWRPESMAMHRQVAASFRGAAR